MPSIIEEEAGPELVLPQRTADALAQKAAAIHAEIQTDAEIALDRASLADLVGALAEIERLKTSQAAVAAILSDALSAQAAQSALDNKAYDQRAGMEELRQERDKLAAQKERLVKEKKTSQAEFAYVQQRCQTADIEATGLRGQLLALQDELAAAKKLLSQGLRQTKATFASFETTMKEDLRMTKNELELQREIVRRTERVRTRAAQADEEKRRRLDSAKAAQQELAAIFVRQEQSEDKARELAIENEELRK